MTILSRFPFLECLLDKSDAEALEQRFYEACERAGINPSSAYAEQITYTTSRDTTSGAGGQMLP